MKSSLTVFLTLLLTLFLTLSISTSARADNVLEDIIDGLATVASAGGYAAFKEGEIKKIEAQFVLEKAKIEERAFKIAKEEQANHSKEMIDLYDRELRVYSTLGKNADVAAQLFLGYIEQLNPYIVQRHLAKQQISTLKARAGIDELLKEEAEIGKSDQEVLQTLNDECTRKNLISCLRLEILKKGLQIGKFEEKLIEASDDSHILQLQKYLLTSYVANINKGTVARSHFCSAAIKRRPYEKLLGEKTREKKDSALDKCLGGGSEATTEKH